MKPDLDYVERLVKILTNNGLSEISLEDGEQAITIRKDSPEVFAVPAQTPTTIPVKENQSEDAIKCVIDNGKVITSPMVGTFYMSTSPDAESFVEVGSEVNEGDVVCIIEAMKLMNEIKSEISGKIKQICVKNGEPVEYGQVLMYLE
ncbi:MAG: acetyl-CoA carboxylase biotin carboxyl carrier protein [bacterium]|nr:acetyl-CoA carboxylase biotin carboxyl carrier protein [bacterium]